MPKEYNRPDESTMYRVLEQSKGAKTKAQER